MERAILLLVLFFVSFVPVQSQTPDSLEQEFICLDQLVLINADSSFFAYERGILVFSGKLWSWRAALSPAKYNDIRHKQAFIQSDGSRCQLKLSCHCGGYLIMELSKSDAMNLTKWIDPKLASLKMLAWH